MIHIPIGSLGYLKGEVIEYNGVDKKISGRWFHEAKVLTGHQTGRLLVVGGYPITLPNIDALLPEHKHLWALLRCL